MCERINMASRIRLGKGEISKLMSLITKKWMFHVAEVDEANWKKIFLLCGRYYPNISSKEWFCKGVVIPGFCKRK